jgi:hypothetical protein
MELRHPPGEKPATAGDPDDVILSFSSVFRLLHSLLPVLLTTDRRPAAAPGAPYLDRLREICFLRGTGTALLLNYGYCVLLNCWYYGYCVLLNCWYYRYCWYYSNCLYYLNNHYI